LRRLLLGGRGRRVLGRRRRGRAAGDAIRHVARRFGLRHSHARAFITDAIALETRVTDGL
jgi:hypothetical protein